MNEQALLNHISAEIKNTLQYSSTEDSNRAYCSVDGYGYGYQDYKELCGRTWKAEFVDHLTHMAFKHITGHELEA